MTTQAGRLEALVVVALDLVVRVVWALREQQTQAEAVEAADILAAVLRQVLAALAALAL